MPVCCYLFAFLSLCSFPIYNLFLPGCVVGKKLFFRSIPRSAHASPRLGAPNNLRLLFLLSVGHEVCVRRIMPNHVTGSGLGSSFASSGVKRVVRGLLCTRMSTSLVNSHLSGRYLTSSDASVSASLTLSPSIETSVLVSISGSFFFDSGALFVYFLKRSYLSLF